MKRRVFKSFITLMLMYSFCGYAGRFESLRFHTVHAKGTPGPKGVDKSGDSRSVFKIQILALCCHLPMQAKVFERCGKVDESIFQSEYIYTVGDFKNPNKARKYLVQLQKKGYLHAFVVEFVDGTRVSSN